MVVLYHASVILKLVIICGSSTQMNVCILGEEPHSFNEYVDCLTHCS